MPDLTLTFDNGPEPDVTPAVLDILAERGIRTTFFVIGQKLADPRRRALAERAHDEGHWIGNHTFSHSVPLGLKPEPDTPEREIGRTQDLIGGLSRPDKLFRPFGGGGLISRALLSPAVVDHLVAGRYTCVLWNAIPRDWEDPDGWVERALAQCRNIGRTLMVLHDLPTGAMAHLPRFLDAADRERIALRQDIPPDLVPIRSGRIALPLVDYVGDPPSESRSGPPETAGTPHG